MNTLQVSIAGYFLGLVLSAILVAPLGMISFIGSTIFYSLSMGATIVLANSFKDKNNPSRPSIVGAAGLFGFLFAALFTGSIAAAVLTAMCAAVITKNVP